MARIRTGFSFRSATGHLNEVIDRIIACGYKAAPITDRASTFGFSKWTKIAKKNNLRPVYGIELAVTRSYSEKKPSISYWAFLAINDIKSINLLLKQATQQYNREPMLTYEQALSAKGVVKIIGHESLIDLITTGENIYVGLSPSIPTSLLKNTIAKGFNFIACSDNKYTNECDDKFYEILCEKEASLQTYPQHILTPSEWKQSLKYKASEELMDIALSNMDSVLEMCQATLKKAEIVTPEKPKSLRQMCVEGAAKLGVDLTNDVYRERLDRELSVIDSKNFEDYFYIIADMMIWARETLLCGPARGSSCGSLVCYLLEITTIDPIPYGLLFERFLSLDRSDMPDIDIDFSDTKRHLVIERMQDIYGVERVAKLGTVMMYRPQSAINETAKALNIPKWEYEKVSASMIDRAPGDARFLNCLEDTFKQTTAGKEFIAKFPEMMVATRLEGHPRHASQHAAGIVITNDPIIDFVAFDWQTGGTHCDKRDAEDLNLLKIDALGLTQLSVFEDALALAGLDRLALEKIPLDDKKAFDVLNSGNWSGIFQFNGYALQGLAKQVKIDCFNDIVSLTALARPGPMESGGAQDWVHCRNGANKPRYAHKIFEQALTETLGVLVYQETIMRIARECGDLSWEDVTGLRRAIGKSQGGEAVDKFGQKFKEGVLKKGIDPEIVNRMWEKICHMGMYCFNKSHAVAYAMISYQCMWLKAHYPHEFAAATLQHETDSDRMIKLLRELDKEGIKYAPVDINLSTDKWVVGVVDVKRILVGPVSNVKGIGPKMLSEIMEVRTGRTKKKLSDRIMKILGNAKTPIDSLYPVIDTFNKLYPTAVDKLKAGLNGSGSYTKIEDIRVTSVDTPVLIICTIEKITNFIDKKGFTNLHLRLADDTSTVFAKIDARKYITGMGVNLINETTLSKTIFEIHGTIPRNAGFSMVYVDKILSVGAIE